MTPRAAVVVDLDELEQLGIALTSLRGLVGDIAHAYGLSGAEDGERAPLDTIEMLDLFVTHGLVESCRGGYRAGPLLSSCLMASDERTVHPAQ